MTDALVTGHNSQIQEYAEKVHAFVKQNRDKTFATKNATQGN